jgi:hypothetical protein
MSFGLSEQQDQRYFRATAWRAGLPQRKPSGACARGGSGPRCALLEPGSYPPAKGPNA